MAQEQQDDGWIRLVLIVLAVFFLFPVVMMVMAIPMMGMMGWWGVGETHAVWGFGSMLVWLLVLVGIGYLLYRAFVTRVEPTGPMDKALQELRLSYARGELSDEEFEERREKLRDDDQ